MKILAKTLEGLEHVLADEITSIGGSNIKILKRAVQYEGDRAVLYKSNILLRTALRILVIKKEFVVKNEQQLYRAIFEIPWETIMKLQDTFAIDSTTNSEVFTHSKYVALKSKDAIADRFVKNFGKRPNVNVHTPTYRINIHIRGTKVTLSLDSSGESLHMRGYRMNTVDAPINEVLASGLILLSGWDRHSPLIDPMCGSGTFLIEAAQLALNIPPQLKNRRFGFKKWKSFDSNLYDSLWEGISKEIKDIPVQISGSDKSLRCVKVTQQNLLEANLSDKIQVIKKDFFKFHPPKGSTIITNPPYDERLKESDINQFYKNIGEKIKKDFHQTNIWIFSGNLDALKYIVLENIKEHSMMNGGLPAKFINYDWR
ncbi:MAG: THUMP domain-containing protein [Saprospiraceae bacterium]|nr:THUMP domain-containing protein [Saprospiraceae bacterium]